MHLLTDHELRKRMDEEGRMFLNEEEKAMRKKRNSVIENIISVLVSIVASIGTALLILKLSGL